MFSPSRKEEKRKKVEETRRSERLTKRSSKHDIPLDLGLSVFHLLEQPSVSNDSSGVSNLLAGLVETGDNSNDRSFWDVGELGDLLKGL